MCLLHLHRVDSATSGSDVVLIQRLALSGNIGRFVDARIHAASSTGVLEGRLLVLRCNLVRFIARCLLKTFALLVVDLAVAVAWHDRTVLPNI